VNERKEFGDPLNKNLAEVFFKLSTLTYNLAYHLAERGGWRTSVGVSGMYQQNRNKGEEKLIPEYNQFDLGTFLFTRKSYDKLTLSGGLRGDMRRLNSMPLEENNDFKFTAYKRNFGDFSGSVGLTYELTKDISLRANIARGYRAPSIAELSSNGAHEGTNRFEYGQQNLRTETSLQGDLGLEFNTTHFTFGMNAYYNNINNYIFYRKLESISGGDSIVNDNGEELTAFRFDQSRARLAGFETNLIFTPIL
jgi:iron complex outermembrane receptor protein